MKTIVDSPFLLNQRVFAWWVAWLSGHNLDHGRCVRGGDLGRECLEFSPAWVFSIEQLEPLAQAQLTEAQRAVQTWLLAALPDAGHASGHALGEMVETIGPERAVHR